MTIATVANETAKLRALNAVIVMLNRTIWRPTGKLGNVSGRAKHSSAIHSPRNVFVFLARACRGIFNLEQVGRTFQETVFQTGVGILGIFDTATT
jgi:hypothetical protein